MKYRNDVIRSFFLLHIRANLCLMLARGYTSCHRTRSTLTCNDCSKQRAKSQMACKKSRFKSYRPLVGTIEMQGSCTAAATKSHGAHACYSSNVCGYSTTVYLYTLFINEYTVPCCRCYTKGMYKVLK